MIRLDSPGPALFRQKRYGFNNQLIEVLKFRTMYQEMSDSNAERLTRAQRSAHHPRRRLPAAHQPDELRSS